MNVAKNQIPAPALDVKKINLLINVLKEFKNKVDNNRVTCFDEVIQELSNFLEKEQKKQLIKLELQQLYRSEWSRTVLLSALELGGITIGLLKKAFGRNSAFFYEIISRLIKKGYLREASEQEKIDFLNRNRRYFTNLGRYHLHKLRVFLLTSKGLKVAKTLQQLEEKQKQLENEISERGDAQ